MIFVKLDIFIIDFFFFSSSAQHQKQFKYNRRDPIFVHSNYVLGKCAGGLKAGFNPYGEITFTGNIIKQLNE